MYKKIKEIESKIKECEIIAVKLKAMNFANLQTFDSVAQIYDLGEPYIIKGVGYTVITYKGDKLIKFVVIMKSNSVWQNHWQDVDKRLDIKQGVYMDLFTGKEYKDSLHVKAFEPSYFKAIGSKDLVIKGEIYKK